MSISQLSRLLPLPDDELKQVLDFAATLSNAEAAEHFRNLLGDSPEAVDFIATFNSKRQQLPSSKSSSSTEPVPRSVKAPKKKKASLHTPAPRQIKDHGPVPGTAYNKDAGSDYISRRPSPAAVPSGSSSPRISLPQKSATPPPPKPPPSAAGHLISDVRKSKPKSTPSSRSSTPAPNTKVNVTGGTAMRGASTALSDLDDAIRVLETTTNPTQASDVATRRCNCVAARHPLLAAAPNCLNCGKVICVKEGLGPCTFCGTPLLSSAEVQSMIRELRDERGREKMAVDRAAHKKPEVSRTPAPFSSPRETPGDVSEAQAKALEHRDRLLGFQAQNARRTTVRDEASDFDVGGGNMWASPEERAREFKRQQKLLREMEWNSRPDYEKRRQVMSIDLVGGKAVMKMAAIERPKSPGEQNKQQLGDSSATLEEAVTHHGDGSGGRFSKNPLLGGLIKPVFDVKGKGNQLEGRKAGTIRWRRVQDDSNDNEAVILDGGVYGGRSLTRQATNSTVDEPACG
ncbi:zf-C2HC5-domain-containing protein [Whalleya microplaca]|nr:zf-C2HC5-domain-containing protein [Whalleya microplaca]